MLLSTFFISSIFIEYSECWWRKDTNKNKKIIRIAELTYYWGQFETHRPFWRVHPYAQSWHNGSKKLLASKRNVWQEDGPSLICLYLIVVRTMMTIAIVRVIMHTRMVLISWVFSILRTHIFSYFPLTDHSLFLVWLVIGWACIEVYFLLYFRNYYSYRLQ